jgi:transcriptional regulator with XRE-family HTH domain
MNEVNSPTTHKTITTHKAIKKRRPYGRRYWYARSFRLDQREELLLPRKGWVRELRKALGLTLAETSILTGVSASAITRLERDESKGKVRLQTLQNLFSRMGCELRYYPEPHLCCTFTELAQFISPKKILSEQEQKIWDARWKETVERFPEIRKLIESRKRLRAAANKL